jgi:hypothetical protein
MAVTYPILGDVWPFSEAAAPPELAALRLDVFFTDPKKSSIRAAQWMRLKTPLVAPRASYALRVSRKAGRGELARWNPGTGVWDAVAQFLVPDDKEGCSIIELKGIVLGGVSDVETLSVRLRALLQSELTEMKIYRLTSKVLSVMSIIILFYSVRSGVESNAIEPFALIFALAFGVGLIAVGLRARCRTISELGMTRMREQFQFEYRAADHAPLGVHNVTAILKEYDLKREEDAVVFGFLLLLCFVYFISPLVVVAVIVALIIVTLMTGDLKSLRMLGMAFDRTETRLEQSFLSFRAGDDNLAPPALRHAKKQVLRDRVRRYSDMLGKVRETQARVRLTQDIGMAVAFIIIFSAYAFPIAAGFQKLSIGLKDSLIATSLFSVAPVIVLLSIAKSTVAMSQIVNRHLLNMAR